MSRHWVDITAVGFFIIEWTAYALTLEHSVYGRDSLSARMNRYREVWVRRLLDRDARMVDMQIMASLQNGTAFFASTSLIALGGALALLHATNDAITILSKLYEPLPPKDVETLVRQLVEAKFWSEGQIEIQGLQNAARAMKYVGSLEKDVDLTKLIDTSFLPSDLQAIK